MTRMPVLIDNNQSFPKRLQLGLIATVLEDLSEDDDVELLIILQCTNVNLRQLAALFTVTDHFYSRMYYDGIYNYARFEKEQIQIKEFRIGSVEIILNTLENTDPSRIILLWLLIKYLPQAFLSLSTAVSNLAKAFHDYQEGQQLRETRKALREDLKQDKQLEKLDKSQFARLASLMSYFYARETKLLVQAEKCIKQNVKSIEIRKTKKRRRNVRI